MKNKKGFTLIELLVVIAIIGLLSTLAVVALNNARAKSRDARRVSDIKQIQTALELYLNDRSSYPGVGTLTAGTHCTGTGVVNIAGSCINNGSDNLTTTCGAGDTYMASVPDDPQPADHSYCYSRESASSYSLRYYLEGDTAGIDAGDNTATPAGIEDN